jgi:hypothetical protein
MRRRAVGHPQSTGRRGGRGPRRSLPLHAQPALLVLVLVLLRLVVLDGRRHGRRGLRLVGRLLQERSNLEWVNFLPDRYFSSVSTKRLADFCPAMAAW